MSSKQQTLECYTVVSKIVCDKFGATVKHEEKGNVLTFDIAKLNRVGPCISLTFLKDAEGSEGSEGSGERANSAKDSSKTGFSVSLKRNI